jgi:imidazolonepropionase-like amidohydrolase
MMKIHHWLVALLLVGASAEGQETALVIEGVTVVDGTGKPPVANLSIVVEGNRISRVAPGRVEAPAGARRINGAGKWVIPGLMDVHVHLRGGRSGANEEEGLRALHGYLYSGVTTIYDTGNNPDFLFALRDKERSGQIVAPRIFAAGALITCPDGHGGQLAVTIEDWPKDREKLDAHIARKPDIVKITQDEHGWGTRPLINLMPVELLERIIRYYHEHGIRTTIHTSNELRTWEAIYAGVDTLAHPVIQGPVSDKYLNLMKVKRIPQASTLTIGEGYSRLAEHPEFLDQPLYEATLDPKEIVRLKTEESKKQQENRWAWWMKVMTPVAQENLKKLNQAGGVVALGTDQSLGPAVHRELELLVAGGISPLDAIKIGTLNAAIFLGKERELGTVEAGKLADLVILTADPSKDINNAKLVDTVIKDGKVIDRGRLQIPANLPATQ